MPYKKPKIDGVLILKDNEQPCLLESTEVASELGLREHKLKFSAIRKVPKSDQDLYKLLQSSLSKYILHNLLIY